ncbi:hypothetical protein TNCV_4621791 [Trichonephila clavipes]|nr:hypothetical protein TNCV_4621791 [Trichonephila clavipes]
MSHLESASPGGELGNASDGLPLGGRKEIKYFPRTPQQIKVPPLGALAPSSIMNLNSGFIHTVLPHMGQPTHWALRWANQFCMEDCFHYHLNGITERKKIGILQWLPANVSIPGHENADRLAKEALCPLSRTFPLYKE